MKRLLTLLATLAASAIFAAGCGGDDNDSGGGGGDGGSPVSGDTQSTDTPNKDEAIDRCYEEAKKLEGQARETAEAGCKAADTGDTEALEQEANEQKDEAKQQCLDATKQIPDEAQRKQAEDACEKFGE